MKKLAFDKKIKQVALFKFKEKLANKPISNERILGVEQAVRNSNCPVQHIVDLSFLE